MASSATSQPACTGQQDPIHAISQADGMETVEFVEASPTQYSVFTKVQKRWIIFLAAFAGWFSTLSSFIFFPAITTLAEDLHTTIEKINLTVTSYLIVSGLAPSLVGEAAETFGRRPTYIICLSIYLVANIGLALQSSFPALFVLRMLQSAGISGTVAVTYGVLADIASPAERGSYVGAIAFGTNTAPSLGPVLGAVLADRKSWRWIFWLLAMLCSSCLVAIFFSLPETARRIVGNGNIAVKGIYCTPFNKPFNDPLLVDGVEQASTDRQPRAIPNPLASLSLLSRKDVAIVIAAIGILYTTYSCLQASLATLFMHLYGYGQLEAGLIYIPFGFGCALAACFTGRLVDRDYRITAKSHGVAVDVRYDVDMLQFPIEKARLRSFHYPALTAIAATVGYGWSIEAKAHVAVPVTLQLILGGTLQCCFTILNTLLVDICHKGPATVQAACNLVRCLTAAGGLAVLQLAINSIGIGFTFTVVAAFSAIYIPLLYIEYAKGLKWRRSQNELENRRRLG